MTKILPIRFRFTLLLSIAPLTIYIKLLNARKLYNAGKTPKGVSSEREGIVNRAAACLNKTWLKHINILNETFAVLNLSYVKLLLFIWIYKSNKIHWNSKMIVESCFQRFYWGNRVHWFRIWYCQQHVANIFCCLRLKSKQISEFSQKRGFNLYCGNWMCRFDFINATNITWQLAFVVT